MNKQRKMIPRTVLKKKKANKNITYASLGPPKTGNFKLWAHNAVMFQSLVQYKAHTQTQKTHTHTWCRVFFVFFVLESWAWCWVILFYFCAGKKVPRVFLSEHFNFFCDPPCSTNSGDSSSMLYGNFWWLFVQLVAMFLADCVACLTRTNPHVVNFCGARAWRLRTGQSTSSSGKRREQVIRLK